jgi:hypothetical protein
VKGDHPKARSRVSSNTFGFMFELKFVECS